MKEVKSLLLVLFVGALFILPTHVAAASALLENITVEGIEPLGLARNVYNLGYSTPFDYVNISATPKSEGVTIEGVGKLPAQAGANQYVITATNGTATETSCGSARSFFLKGLCQIVLPLVISTG